MLYSASRTGESSSEPWPVKTPVLPASFQPRSLPCVPRLLLTQEQKHIYAQVARYCNRSADLIPLSFVLGEAPV